jgi:hypothetical protein
MIVRLLVTTIAALLALGAFWGNALGAGHLFNPFGILFLFLTVLIWFKWEIIREAFHSVKDESDLPIIRLSSKIIGGMETLRRNTPARRSSSSNR